MPIKRQGAVPTLLHSPPPQRPATRIPRSRIRERVVSSIGAFGVPRKSSVAPGRSVASSRVRGAVRGGASLSPLRRAATQGAAHGSFQPFAADNS
eukprot:365334-Chlamydomonas_euryale.AAC.23